MGSRPNLEMDFVKIRDKVGWFWYYRENAKGKFIYLLARKERFTIISIVTR